MCSTVAYNITDSYATSQTSFVLKSILDWLYLDSPEDRGSRPVIRRHAAQNRVMFVHIICINKMMNESSSFEDQSMGVLGCGR